MLMRRVGHYVRQVTLTSKPTEQGLNDILDVCGYLEEFTLEIQAKSINHLKSTPLIRALTPYAFRFKKLRIAHSGKLIKDVKSREGFQCFNQLFGSIVQPGSRTTHFELIFIECDSGIQNLFKMIRKLKLPGPPMNISIVVNGRYLDVSNLELEIGSSFQSSIPSCPTIRI